MDSQYDNCYPVKVDFVANEAGRKKRLFVEEEELARLRQLPERIANIGYFEKIIRNENPETNRPRIGVFCQLVPDELIIALGAQPVRLDCGNSVAVNEGEYVLAGDVCPLAKSSFGMFLDKDSLANSCEALVLAATCDAKRKMGELLNDIKPVFTLVLPPEKNSRGYASAVLKEMKRLTRFLEVKLGVKLKKRNVKRAIAASRARSALVRKLTEMRMTHPSSMSVRDLFLIIQSSFFGAPLDEWNAEVDKAITELSERPEPARQQFNPRIVLTGAPVIWPNFKPLVVIEESGAFVVADTLCSGTQTYVDPVVVDEGGKSGLLRALALKHIFASLCPCFISQSTRINRVLELVDEGKADGVINYALRLCQLFDVESFRLEQVLKARKIPFLNLRTDYGREDVEQLRVRVEAFLETI